MSGVSLRWDVRGRLFAGALESPVAELHRYGGPGTARLPAFVALVHLPGAPKPMAGEKPDVQADAERIVKAWFARAAA